MDVRHVPAVGEVLAVQSRRQVSEGEAGLYVVHRIGVGEVVQPIFLVGADEFASFLTWKEPERVLELARLGVATRPGVERARLDGVLSSLARPERVSFFDIEPLAVSSSDIRRRAGSGEPIWGLVPPAVEAEIARLGLYRAG